MRFHYENNAKEIIEELEKGGKCPLDAMRILKALWNESSGGVVEGKNY